MVGMRMPSHCAAPSTVVPGSTLTRLPSHVGGGGGGSNNYRPSHCAAPSTVVPGSTLTRLPSIVRVTGTLHDLDGVVLAGLTAHIAASAEALVHLVLFVRTIRDGAHRADLRAEGAADAVVRHPVADQGRAAAGRTTLLVQVGFVLLAKIPERGSHRVGRGLTQAAEASAADVVGEGLQLFARKS